MKFLMVYLDDDDSRENSDDLEELEEEQEEVSHTSDWMSDKSIESGLY